MPEYISPELRIVISIGVSIVGGATTYAVLSVMKGYEHADNFFWLSLSQGDTPQEAYAYARKKADETPYLEKFGIKLACRKFRKEHCL